MVIIYGFLALIDYTIYSLAGAILRLIVEIASVEFFTSDQISGITSRIYVVVGVLMLFKLIITGVQYFINPDIFDDKEKGFGGLLVRAATSLALLVLVPVVFKFAMAVQQPIVESIPNIIFGTEERVNFKDDSVGKNLSFQVLSVFVSRNTESPNKPTADQEIKDLPSFLGNVTAGCPTVSLFGIFGSTKDCIYDYKIIISTAAGVFLCYVLLAMTLDVATRTIKFGIVQILAPIPIISYVFNKEKLSEFAHMAIKIYLDLFLRLAVIYFMTFAVKQLFDSNLIKDLSEGDPFRNILVTVILVIALFSFAKNAPKFITDLLGLKDVSSDDMKDMFTRAGGMLGATVGAGKNFIAGRANARNEAMKNMKPEDLALKGKAKKAKIKEAVRAYNKKQNEGHKIPFGHGVYGRAFRSSGSALRTGMYQSYVKGKGYNDTLSASEQSGHRSYDLEKSLQDNNISRMDYYKEVAKRKMGIDSNLDVMNAEIEAAKKASDLAKAALDFGHTQRGAKFSTLKFDNEFVASLEAKGKQTQFSVGLDGDGNEIKVNLKDMAIGGKYSINTVENMLRATIEDKDGRYKNMGLEGQEIISKAQDALDALQGYGDQFSINASKKDAEYKKKVGYKDNLRYDTVIQEAIEASLIHLGDTQYGRKIYADACKEGMFEPKMENGKVVTDDKGNIVYTTKVKDERIGDWLALNKAQGQVAQKENIAAKGGEAASAVTKSIVDKYAKK